MTTLTRESVSVWSSSNLGHITDEPDKEPRKVRLILVDDDDVYREAAGAELTDLGFEVATFPDGAAMFEYFAQGKSADIVVLDWKLPTVSGIDLLPQLRRRGILVPVVFLTGMPATAYENVALDRGALDFVDKSRGVGILAKRLKLIVEAGKRPQSLPVEEVVNCGQLMLRPRVSRAYWRDNDVNLTVTEFNIVRLLINNAGEYVTYRAIYDCVHCVGFIAGSGEDGYRTNVRSSVKRIRNKFRAIDADFAEIENFPAFGYRWRHTPSRPT
jgi:two-component system response regulator ChvI